MHFFVHLAVDAFGSAALARLQDWVEDRGEEARARHLFVWAGAGEAPRPESFWRPGHPRWDDELPLPWSDEGPPEQLDRGRTAARLSSEMLAPGGWQHVKRLLVQMPRDRFGAHRVVEPVCTIAGSLADPRGSAGILGVGDGFAALFDSGRVHVPLRIVGGVGAEGSTLADPAMARCLAAQSLTDFQEHWQTRGASAGYWPAIFLVGEAGPESQLLDLRSQATLAAMALEGAYRSIEMGDEIRADAIDPFCFSQNDDGFVFQGRPDRPYDASQPFSVVGGYRVSSPSHRVGRLVAVSACRRSLERLADQKLIGGVEDFTQLDVSTVPDDERALLGESERATLQKVIERLNREPRISWDKEEIDLFSGGWDNFSTFEGLARKVFRSAEWDELFSAFGVARIGRLALRDWQGGMRELAEVAVRGLVPRREQYFAHLERNIVRTLLLELDVQAQAIAARTFQDVVQANPHRLIQALLAQILVHLDKDGLSRSARRGGPGAEVDDATALLARLDRFREGVEDAVEAVPNPFALFARYLPYAVVAMMAVYLLPFDLRLLDPPLERLLLGVGLGAAICGAFTMRFIRVARGRARTALEVWTEEFKRALIARDEGRRVAVLGEMRRQVRDAVMWFAGGEDDPPLPESPMPILTTKPVEPLDILGEGEDRFRVQSALMDAPEHFEAAAQSHRLAEGELVRAFQPSRLETILPPLSPDRPELLDEVLRDVLGISAEDDVDAAAADWVGRVTSEIDSRDADTSDWQGTGLFAGDVPDADPALAWRRTFVLPESVGLLDPEQRTKSSGFGFFRLMDRGLRGRSLSAMTLPVLLADLKEGEGLEGKDGLRTRFSHLAVPSIRSEGAAVEFFFVQSSETDPLTGRYSNPKHDGEGVCSMILQVRMGLSAQDIVYFPNADRPTEPLGRAWKSWEDAGGEPPPCLRGMRSSED